MATTKSKSRNKGKDTSSDAATKKVTHVQQVATKTRNTHMADTPSIIEFSEDVGTAEAPVPLPVGEYPAEIRAAEIKDSAKGNKYVSVQFFIAPEAYPADYTEGEPDGMILTYNRVGVQDTPAGRHRMRKFTEAIGAPAGSKLDVNDWVGRTATVSVQHDTYEGETRAAIGKVVAS